LFWQHFGLSLQGKIESGFLGTKMYGEYFDKIKRRNKRIEESAY
jgi:hypothetical protein